MARRLLLRTFICLALIFAPGVVLPQFLDLKEVSNEVFLVVGDIKVLEVYFPERVSVRNPEIADIDSVSDREIILIAKVAGSTAMTVWDKEGEKTFYITVYSQDPGSLKKRLEKTINQRLGIKDVFFEKNDASGKIMVIGELTAAEKEKVDKVLEPFTEGIDNLLVVGEAKQMVEVDCHILELTKSFSEVFGLDWSGAAGSSPSPLTTITSAATDTADKISEIFRLVDFTRSALDVEIMAAVNQGKGKVLAKPKLLCLSGEEASFLVGGEVPVVKVTSSSAGDTVAEDVEYKEYGVKLNIQPVVFDNGDIKLNLTTEVKELSTEGQYVRSDDTTVKAFVTRNTSTVLRLKPNQAVIISGLFKDKVTKDDIGRVPGLGNIPILGALFRSKDYQDDQTELVISLVPRLINTEKDDQDKIKVTEDKLLSWKELETEMNYSEGEAALNGYILEVQRTIFQSLDYPRLAQEAGWQGAVKIKLHLNREGELLDAKISKSSGYLSFDDNVLKTAKSLSPYPSFPSNIELKDLWIDVPIVYEID